LTKLEWTELEGVLASLLVDVATDLPCAHEWFVEWCKEYKHEIKAVTFEGIRPLTDSSLAQFMRRP
jgi:hypothetical protein